MKAKFGNIVCNERNNLGDVLPLDTPYTIFIDPSNLCNFKCKFCAIQSNDEKRSYKKQVMSLSLFKKIIDDLSDFKHKLKILRINGQGEPLINKNYCAMVRYAKEKNVSEYIETITNGSLLSPELNRDIVSTGLNRLRISIYGLDEEGYKDVTGKKIDFNRFVENIADLYDVSRGKMEIYLKITDASVPTDDDKNKFFEIFGDICDKLFIDNVVAMWSDFDEIYDRVPSINRQGMHGQKIQNIKVCPFPFYSFGINSDGEVTLCCADWKRKLVVGNVNSESLLDIWNGDVYQSFLIDNLSGNKNSYEMCRKCILPMVDCNDNIDDYADDLIRKYKKINGDYDEIRFT